MSDTADITASGETADLALLERLRAVVREVDPMPALVPEMARAVFALRTLDDELASVVLDSELVEELSAVRGEQDVRLLSFESPAVGVELQVVRAGPRRDITGQVVGPAPASVVVQTGGELPDERAVVLDDDGMFLVPDLPAGPARVRVTATGGSTVTTPWILL